MNSVFHQLYKPAGLRFWLCYLDGNAVFHRPFVSCPLPWNRCIDTDKTVRKTPAIKYLKQAPISGSLGVSSRQPLWRPAPCPRFHPRITSSPTHFDFWHDNPAKYGNLCARLVLTVYYCSFVQQLLLHRQSNSDWVNQETRHISGMFWHWKEALRYFPNCVADQENKR